MGESAEVYTLTLADGASIAFRRMPATAPAGTGRLPGVMFCGGFRSDMTGSKALALEDRCRRAGQAFIRFDYTGHGQSSGHFQDGTIGDWLRDALAVLDQATEGPQILVGSSMGGWIAALAALARPERVAGLVGVAAAADFTEDLIWDRLSDDQRLQILQDGLLLRPSAYVEEPDPISRRLIEEARDHLLLGDPVAITAPVRLIHGMADQDVPWRQSLRLAERIIGPDVRLVLVKDGGHRLSRPEDLALIASEIDRLSGCIADGQARGSSHGGTTEE